MTRTGRPHIAPDPATLSGRVAARIRARRRRRKLTVPQAAAAAGIATRTWYALESGFVPLKRLPAIAEVLGCRVADLMR